jgi:NADH-quinone oxidoreductase subunit F
MTPILTANTGYADQPTLGAARARGAYRGLEKALTMRPQDVVAEVTASGLRGRGGAGFPTGRKWGFLRPEPGHPVYLLCNADESEPGTFKDRYLMERDPHLVLEGIAIAAYAIGAHIAYIYLRGEYRAVGDILSRALDEARASGIIEDTLIGSSYPLQVRLQIGAGAYICGEETGLIQSLEGKRGYPRVRPPFPAVHGFVDEPTVVNNVETLANVPWILREGGAAFAQRGTEHSPGTKLISVCGAVNRPGVYEVDMGYAVAAFLSKEAGGVLEHRALKALIPGGTSVPLLTAAEVSGVTLDFESMRQAGTLLGSGGMIVFDETADMPHALANIAGFYAHESCGECTPCREGTGWFRWILERLLAGQGRPDDLERLLRLCDLIEGRTICALGDAAVQPVRSFVTKFRPEFEALLPKTIDTRPQWQRHGHAPRTARHGPPAEEAAASEPVTGPPTARY